MAFSSWDGKIRIGNVRTGEIEHTFEGHEEGVIALAYSEQSQHLVSASLDQTIRVWTIGKRQCVQIIGNHPGKLSCVAI